MAVTVKRRISESGGGTLANRFGAQPISKSGSVENLYTTDANFSFCEKYTDLPDCLQRLNATYTRNSEKRVVQDGALVTLSANQFGTSQDPVTGLYGYVPEPAATNLATYSDGNAATYGSRTNVADGTAVPGFTNGIAFGDNSVERTAYKLISGTIGVVYSVSVFVIMDDGGAPVVSSNYVSGDMRIMADGYGTTAGVTRYIGNGVYRISASFTAITGGIRGYGVTKQTGQSARTFRITGIQVETGLRATSYIATTGSTASRSADVLTVPLANITGFSSAGYTLFADTRTDVSGAATRVALEINDMTLNNRCYVGVGSTDLGVSNLLSSGTTYMGITGGSVGKTRGKIAASVIVNSGKVAANGIAATEDTSLTMPLLPTNLQIGAVATNSAIFNSFIFRAQLIPQALTQAQINGLTT